MELLDRVKRLRRRIAESSAETLDAIYSGLERA
jgi:hypothetical protein